MTDLWLIYALLGMLCSGFLSFTGKISAERKHDSSLINLYAYMIAFLVFSIVILYRGMLITTAPHIITGFFAAFVSFFIYKTRILSLQHISSTTFFVNYRILSSTLLIFLGMFFFREYITLNEIIGMVFGVVVFILLIERTKKGNPSQNFKIGLVYLLISVVCISFAQVISKYVSFSGYDLLSYIFFCGVWGVILSALFNYKSLSISKLLENRNGIIQVGFFQGFFLSTAIIFTSHALAYGKMAIAYKVVSFAVLIPILLSVIVYKEKITPRQLFAIGLALVSIWLFV